MNPTGYCGLDAFQHVVCNGGCVSKPSSHYTANFPDTLCLGGHRQSGSMRLEYCPVICYKCIFNCWSLWCLSLQRLVNAIPLGSWEAISTLIYTGVKKALGLEMEAFKDMSMLSENEGHSRRLRRGQACTLEYGGGSPFLALQLSPSYICPKAWHLLVPSLTCLLVSSLCAGGGGGPRGLKDNIHYHRAHKTKLLCRGLGIINSDSRV